MTAVLSALRLWAETPIAHALGRALLHFLWEGAAVAAVLAALLLCSRSARVRYGLALAAMLALPLVFAATWALSVDPALPLRTSPHFPAPYRIAPAAGDLPGPAAPGFNWLVLLWMVGVWVCYARSFAGWIGALRLRRRGVCAVPDFWQRRGRELAARLRISRPVLLLESCLADIPVTLGWFRPVILLPIGLLAGLPAEQVEAILLHELAHIRRADFAVNLLLSFVEGLLFYHPAVWWISRVVRAEREHCCDDTVIAHRADARVYAAALARLEHNRAAAREALLAANGGNLMKRIHRMLDSPERPRSGAAPAAVIVLLLVTVAAAIAWTPAPKPEPQATRKLVDQTLVNTYGGDVEHAREAARKAYGEFLAFKPRPDALPARASAAAEPQQAPPAQRPLAEKQDKTRRDFTQAPDNVYLNWLNSDVAYIITDQERAAFKSLQTDEEREKFIEEFWLRRDPTPGTAENEFKEEHYRRIAFSNQHFSTPGGLSGWKTDRGRIYIVYGPPDELEDHPAGPPFPFQEWRYRYIANIGQNVIVQFNDTNRDGMFRMTSDPATLPGAPSAEPPRIVVRAGPNGHATFSVPFAWAAQAYTGSFSIARQGDGVVVMQGRFDPRFGGHSVTLPPGSYRLSVTLRNPNGQESASSTDFNVR